MGKYCRVVVDFNLWSYKISSNEFLIQRWRIRQTTKQNKSQLAVQAKRAKNWKKNSPEMKSILFILSDYWLTVSIRF